MISERENFSGSLLKKLENRPKFWRLLSLTVVFAVDKIYSAGKNHPSTIYSHMRNAIANRHKPYQIRSTKAIKEMIAKEENKKISGDIEEGVDGLLGSELNNADISAAAEELASLALTAKGDESNSDSDEAETLSDPDLWKPHPPTEACPVCFVPLPLAKLGQTYWYCCGNNICSACSKEHVRAMHKSNMKRALKELPKLKETCPFCRLPMKRKTDRKIIGQLEERVLKGDAVATFELAEQHLHGNLGLKEDESKALELYQCAAGMGSAPANFWLGIAYAYGKHGVTVDLKKAQMYADQAVKLNHPQARALAAYFEAGVNDDHVVQHFMLGAAAGVKEMMDHLWTIFYEGSISKEDLEDTLRKYHQACDDMSSEDRERYNAWMKTKEEDNEILREIYNSYYQGVINAKQLKEVLGLVQGAGGG